MTFALPTMWAISLPIEVQRCQASAIGQTEIECTFADVSITPFSVDINVDEVGLDALRSAIESVVISILCDALEFAL